MQRTLNAYVIDPETQERFIITRNGYPTKKAFWMELANNGYKVIRISTNQDLEAMERGFETFAAMIKHDRHIKEHFGHYSEFHDDILKIAEVAQ